MPNWCSSSRSEGIGVKVIFASAQVGGVIQHRARHCQNRRRLEKVPVESAQHPVQPRNPHRHPDARIRRALVQPRAVNRETLAAQQRHILAQPQMIAKVKLEQARIGSWPAGSVPMARCRRSPRRRTDRFRAGKTSRARRKSCSRMRSGPHPAAHLPARRRNSNSGSRWWPRAGRAGFES